MKILISGGLGYLGARFAELLAKTPGYEVTLTTRRRGACIALPAVQVAQVDPGNPQRLSDLCAHHDVVVQLAGMNAAESQRDPAAAIATRTAAIVNLLDAARARGVRRLLYVSTSHVYGTAPSGVIDESTPVNPGHPYAASHLAAEDIVRAARGRGDIDAIVVRLSNSFGPPVQDPSDCWSLVVNDLCRQAVHSRRMVLRTTGMQRRDFVPMSETCRALRLLSNDHPALPADGTINVGSGETHSLLEMADRVGRRVQARLEFRPELQVGVTQDSVGASPFRFHTARLQALGFRPDPDAATRELDRLVEYCMLGEQRK